MIDQHAAGSPATLDGLRFVMVSSSASEVSPTSPTSFLYRQQGALLWGEYTGDTVTTGRFVGQRTGDRIAIDFAHALHANGHVVRGTATSTIERDAEGRLRLVEDFEKDGVAHRSVCVQAD